MLRTLASCIVLFLAVACTESKEAEISPSELARFKHSNNLFLQTNSGVYLQFVHGTDQTAYNSFVSFPNKSTILPGAGLSKVDGSNFVLNASRINSADPDALAKLFEVGEKPVGYPPDAFSLALTYPEKNIATIQTRRIQVVQNSIGSELFTGYTRSIRVWFLLDFDVVDTNGKTQQRIRNAEYINEFFLVDYPDSTATSLVSVVNSRN